MLPVQHTSSFLYVTIFPSISKNVDNGGKNAGNN